MRPCPEYAGELAACAALSAEPEHETAGHLAKCAGCRAALVELKNVAAEHIQVAANLSQPKFSSEVAWRFTNLFAGQRKGGGGLSRLPIFRPVLVCGTLLLAFFLLIWAVQGPKDSMTRQQPTEAGVDPVERTPQELDQTWQALRAQLHHEANSPADNEPRRVGAVVSHYRLKDAYSQAN
ncbi:MAG TPA: hypothetical protein VK633_14710 [Verrucomicrobiae bacterium]|nr:hypothetical protein [Verrucomicrobiae bacterium]